MSQVISARKKTGQANAARLAFGLAVGRRLLMGAITIIAIIFLTFFGLDMARGAVFGDALLRAGGKTLDYLPGLLQGDLGETIEYGLRRLPVPVSEVLPELWVRSFGLLLAALLIAAPIGVALGISAARRRHSHWPVVILFFSIVGISLPSFFLALLLQMAVVRLTGVVGSSVLPVGGFGWDEHILLPALVLAARPLAQIARVTEVTLTDVLERDFVRTARSKGLSGSRVMNVHVLRNVAVPVLTVIGVALRFSLSSLPVVEFFFGWQGLGYHLLKAIGTQDDNLAVGLLVLLSAFFILINLLLEIAYYVIDPRLRGLAEQATRRDSQNVLQWLVALPGRLIRQLAQIWKWISRQLNRAQGRESIPRSPTLFAEQGESAVDSPAEPYSGIWRAWMRGTFGNLPFLLGAVLVAGLVFVVLFGSDVAPRSPYTTRGLTIENGEFTTPPFPPDDQFRWGTDVLGRDILSLVLAGAQQTFLLVVLVVVARLVVGVGLGALAGWFSGSWLDRFLLSVVEIIAAFPTLLLAMILILALDIRTGMRPFIIALCFVGWGETMQFFVRGEVMRIRPQPFIESAVAVGQGTPRILTRHVMPNLIPALISVTALEMGAVLMLLGELGFIGIFIGGGLFAELQWQAPLFHYSDVPEWGALLANVRTYARSFPWTAFYPSLAFFLAIVGLNLFGEGTRKLIEVVGVRVMSVFNRYTFALAAVLVIGFVYWRGSTGALATYERQAQAFSGDQALQVLSVLASPEMEGRALGSRGMERAEAYLAEQYETLGLQPAGESLGYFQQEERGYQRLEAPAELSVSGLAQPLKYGQDVNVFPAANRNSGVREGSIHMVAIGKLTIAERYGHYRYPALDNLGFGDDLLLVYADDYRLIESRSHGGALVIADDPIQLHRRYTLSPFEAPYAVFYRDRTGEQLDTPALWITPETAERILAQANLTLDEIDDRVAALDTDQILDLPLDVEARIAVPSSPHLKEPVSHVIGYLPGAVSNQLGGLDNRLIVVLAQYDCPPVGPEGVYACANDNASGVSLMLEVVRSMRASGYQPLKTFLFVAYSGEGFEGGAWYTPDVDEFLRAKTGFATHYEIEAVVELRGLGTVLGDKLVLSADGSLRLAQLFESAARRSGVDYQMTGSEVDLSLVFRENVPGVQKEPAPRILISWDNTAETSTCAKDDLTNVSAEQMGKAGEVVNLGLMILGREADY